MLMKSSLKFLIHLLNQVRKQKDGKHKQRFPTNGRPVFPSIFPVKTTKNKVKHTYFKRYQKKLSNQKWRKYNNPEEKSIEDSWKIKAYFPKPHREIKAQAGAVGKGNLVEASHPVQARLRASLSKLQRTNTQNIVSDQ